MVYFPLVSPNTKRAFQWWVAQPPINWLYTSRFFSGDGCWQLAIAGRFTWGSQFGLEYCICKLAHFAWDQLGKGRASIKDGRSQRPNQFTNRNGHFTPEENRNWYVTLPWKLVGWTSKKFVLNQWQLMIEPANMYIMVAIVFSICGARWFKKLDNSWVYTVYQYMVTECNWYFVLQDV